MLVRRLSSNFCCVVFFFGSALGACSGGGVRPDKVAPYARPALEFRGIGFEDQSFEGTGVVFKFALVSKDDRPATLTGCPYKLQLKGVQTLRGTIQVQGKLEAKGELPVNTKIAVPWPEGREQVLQFLRRKRLPYKYHLTCELTTPTGKESASNTDAGSIPLPKLPQMDVIQANAERFGRGAEARVNFELSMLNENTFKLKLDKIVYKVYLGETMVSEGDLPLAETIPPSSEFTYDVSTPIFNTHEHGEIMKMLSQSQIEYRLQGAIHLGGFELPLDADGTISFPRGSEE